MSAAVPAQSKAIRKDPAPRSLDPFDNWIELERKDPKIHYVWVNKLSTGVAGMSFYRSRGYAVVKYEVGGVRPKGNDDLREGEPIEVDDVVLMCCKLELKQQIERAGQELADRVNRKMNRRGRTLENLGGIQGLRSDDGTLAIWEEDDGTSEEIRVRGGING